MHIAISLIATALKVMMSSELNCACNYEFYNPIICYVGLLFTSGNVKTSKVVTNYRGCENRYALLKFYVFYGAITTFSGNVPNQHGI